jgi:hypothetical protein
MACIGLAAVDDDSDQVILVADPPQVCGVQLQARPKLRLKTLTVLLARGPQHIHISIITPHKNAIFNKGGTNKGARGYHTILVPQCCRGKMHFWVKITSLPSYKDCLMRSRWATCDMDVKILTRR